MKTASLILERFDGPLSCADRRSPDPAGDEARRAHEEAFADGYAKGLAEAQQRAGDEAQSRLRELANAVDAVTQAKRELQIGAARQAVRAAAALAGAVLPALARRGLVTELVDALAEATKTPAIRSLTIKTGPDAVDALRMALADLDIETPVELIADEEMGAAAASVCWEGGGLDIDLKAATAAGLRALEEQLNEKSE